MKKLLVTWKGLTPIILHSCQCVNPLHPISIELKKLTSKRNKTEDDLLGIYMLGYRKASYIEKTLIAIGKKLADKWEDK